MDMGELILITGLTIWSTMTLGYFISLIIKNAAFVDLIWPVGPMLVALALQQALDIDFSNAFAVVFVLVLVWGARLALHLGFRFTPGHEDWRYQALREKWSPGFIWKSYFTIFMLQGALMFLMVTPLVVAAATGDVQSWQVILGSTIWAFGFIFQVIGDLQLSKFVKTKKKGQFIKTGLWKYTRHPNYFGEVVMWWGLFVIVLSSSYWWVAALSPIVVSVLILQVSGIPMMERRWKGNKQFAKYAKVTNAFFPWFPKKK